MRLFFIMVYTLSFIIVALLIDRYMSNRAHGLERKELLDRLFTAAENIPYETQDVVVDSETKEDDLTPIEDVLDEKFMKAIYGQQSD